MEATENNDVSKRKQKEKSPNPGKKSSGFKPRPSKLLGLTVITEFECGIHPNAMIVRALSRVIHRAHREPTGKGPTAIRRLPSAPKVERTKISGHDTGACQRALVGDSFNDEEWSDDLQLCQTIVFEDFRQEYEPESQRGWVRRHPRCGFQHPKVQQIIEN